MIEAALMELGLMQMGFNTTRKVDQMSGEEMDLFTGVGLAQAEYRQQEARDQEWMARFRSGGMNLG